MSTGKRHLDKEEKIPLTEVNKGDSTNETQESSKEEKKINYFMLGKYENIIAMIAWGVLGYWMVSFSFTTQKIHQKTPIAGIAIDSFGLEWDNSDSQWSSFIGNMDILLPASIAFLLISKGIRSISRPDSQTFRKIFLILSGGGMYAYLFRGGLLFWIFFTFVNYLIIKTFYKQKIFPLLIWGFNIFLIFANDRYQGYNLVNFFHLDFLQVIEDTKQDAVVQWHIVYSMTLLRVISFGIDKYWANNQFRQRPRDKHQKTCDECTKTIDCLKERQEQYHEVYEYDLLSFYSYLLYMPILITGPPLVFNAFLSQLKKPQQTNLLKQKLIYTLRTLLVFVTFIVWNHINFGYAMTTKHENEHIWRALDQKELFFCPFNTLIYIWMKFNCLWKYSKCWAIWDDMEVPENMNRCVFNNYDFEGFWRSWHRGYNQWLIRYIYLPCGGNKTKTWNIWIVFTFVAIWHDLDINLLLWAWGICLILIPEIGLKRHFLLPKYNWLTQTHYWKWICASTNSITMVGLLFTNLVGFGTGYQTLIVFLQKSVSSLSGLATFGICVLDLGLSSLKQMEIREKENKNY